MKLITYVRVSTKRQGASGLGLDGQVEAVARYAVGHEIIREYREVESGKLVDRPELLKAIAHAKRSKAVLVIAKLDRLARNVAFTAALMETSVEFVACDNPHANRLTIHILAAVAEDEARRISERTKVALRSFVANGRVPRRVREMYPEGVPVEVSSSVAGLLGAARPGARRLTREQSARGSAAGAVVRRRLAVEAYSDLAPYVAELKAEGRSLREIAAALDAEGHTTRTGRPWNPVQVARVLKLAA